ncbi:MAG: hypothetical protein GX649_09900, partial [Chloroflexi bacterium]|nr:hypothetical protein [Chloroflexota bacterium]
HFMLDLVRRARAAILAGEWEAFRTAFWERYVVADAAARQANREAWGCRTRADAR